MACPKCGQEQHCPCKNCKEANEGKVVWVWVNPNGPIECGNCGHVMSCDSWIDCEVEELKKEGKWKFTNPYILKEK